MKKACIVVMCLITACVMCACGNQNKVTKQKPIADMITVSSSMGDEGINDAGWSGFEKASEKEDMSIRCLESKDPASFRENLSAAGNDNAKIAVIIGDGGEKTIKKAAEKYKDTNFLVVEGNLKNGSNIGSLSFHEEESGFLAGTAAALSTKSGTVGFLGIKGSSVTEKYEAGFAAGIRSENSSVELRTAYISDQTDSAKAAAGAEKLKKQGADIIMQAVGSSGKDVIEIAEDKGFMVIGTDTDQSVLDSKNVLCSAVKDVKNEVAERVEDAVKGRFDGEVSEFDLKNKGVGLSDNAGNLSDKAGSRTDEWEKAIRKGKFTVPSNQKELNSFKVPEI